MDRSLLDNDVKQDHFNSVLADEFEKEAKGIKSPYLDFLRFELTGAGSYDLNGRIERRLGIDFEKPSLERCINRASYIPPKEGMERLVASLKHFNIDPLNITLGRYLAAGRDVIKYFNLDSVEFPTEKVLAYMNVAEDQRESFQVKTNDLVLSLLSERAVHRLLLNNKKQFEGRSAKVKNYGFRVDELDVTVLSNNKEIDVGVRCQREFGGVYLYNAGKINNEIFKLEKKEWADKKRRIADYIVFFNHLGHHLFYIAGIAEKEFLYEFQPSKNEKNPMASLDFPENAQTILKMQQGETSANYSLRLNSYLRKRISLKELMERL